MRVYARTYAREKKNPRKNRRRPHFSQTEFWSWCHPCVCAYVRVCRHSPALLEILPTGINLIVNSNRILPPFATKTAQILN